ncbi:MAG: hypothetical protein FWE44_04450 [Defluviitaleaceae bacterium]|nr:hypothetical protein [Defluviitaleaceae bacterium]
MIAYEERAKEFANVIMNSEEWRDYAQAYDVAMANPNDADAKAEFLALREEYHHLVEHVIDVLRNALNVPAQKSGCGCGGGGCCGRKGGC